MIETKTKRCLICGNRLKGRQIKFCSVKCRGISTRSEIIINECLGCGEEFETTNDAREAVSCSPRCNTIIRHKKNGSFKNGNTKSFGRYIPNHRAAAEKKLGRKLRKNEIVHHIDCDETNNSEDNLFVFLGHSKHVESHQSLRLLVKELIKNEVVEFKYGKYFLKG